MARPPVTQTYTQFQSNPGVILNVSQLGYPVILTRALCTMVHTLQLRVSRLREVRKITNNCRASMWQNRDSNLLWMLSPGYPAAAAGMLLWGKDNCLLSRSDGLHLLAALDSTTFKETC